MLVSVSMGEIARLAGKNPKTIRRWCKLGFVGGPGARALCSPGGHWRVRVSILKADRERARTLARRSGDFAAEVAGIVFEKALSALRPPRGFARGKSPSRGVMAAAAAEADSELKRAGFVWFPVTVAERVAAVAEFAASRDGEPNQMRDKLPAIRRLGGWLAPRAAGELTYAHDAAIVGVEAGKPFFVAAYGAARLMLADGERVSLAAVCRRFGLPRASVYRRGQNADIQRGIAQAQIEEKASRRSDSWEAQVLYADCGREVKTTHKDPEERFFARPRRRKSRRG
jgi:hypothetical protein